MKLIATNIHPRVPIDGIPLTKELAFAGGARHAVSVGRAPDNDVRLRAAFLQGDLHTCRILQTEDGRLRVEVFHPHGLVRVNNVAVQFGSPTQLNAGDVIEIWGLATDQSDPIEMVLALKVEESAEPAPGLVR
jgi:hypothetical protein